VLTRSIGVEDRVCLRIGEKRAMYAIADEGLFNVTIVKKLLLSIFYVSN
jgi:hypothetical protein